MKNILGASLVAVCMAGFAVTPVSALTFQEMQLQVKELLSRVSSLTSQMNALKAQEEVSGSVAATPTGIVSSSGYSHRICALLNRNLSHGMSGDDVRGVQEFLQSEGFLKAAPTGYFGALTGQAVAQWQAREGLSSVGAVGPRSRDRIKQWCGGSVVIPNAERFDASATRGNAPLTVVFDTWISGFRVPSVYYMIDFGDGTSERATSCLAPADACISPGQNKHTYSQNGSYTATLQKITDPCGGNSLCMAPISKEIVAKQQITVGTVACTKEYKPVCASKQIYCITTPCNPLQQTYSNKCMAEADGAIFSYDGQCRDEWANPADDPQCRAWYDGCNTCSRETPAGPAMCTLRACFQQEKPYCTSYFSSSGNKPPTISGFSGPTTLSVNQTGAWTIRATDPENGTLSYSIQWGDEATIYPYAAMNAERAFTQSTSFTHTYATAGTYTITMTVQDSLGESARTTTTVTVGGGNVVCTMEYAPVCGRLPGCMNTCPAGMYCAMMCQMHPVTTYSNRCFLAAAGAELVHEGLCYSSEI